MSLEQGGFASGTPVEGRTSGWFSNEAGYISFKVTEVLMKLVYLLSKTYVILT